jgi:hypothetical protein
MCIPIPCATGACGENAAGAKCASDLQPCPGCTGLKFIMCKATGQSDALCYMYYGYCCTLTQQCKTKVYENPVTLKRDHFCVCEQGPVVNFDNRLLSHVQFSHPDCIQEP